MFNVAVETVQRSPPPYLFFLEMLNLHCEIVFISNQIDSKSARLRIIPFFVSIIIYLLHPKSRTDHFYYIPTTIAY